MKRMSRSPGGGVYLYRAIDQFGQVIDVLMSEKRDLAATRRFFTRALEHRPFPAEVITDKTAVYPPVLEELAPGAWHGTVALSVRSTRTDPLASSEAT
jgi:IS6 family transposase